MVETVEEVEPLSWRAYALVGVLWFLALRGLEWMGVEASAPYLGISSLAFLAMGALCWYNGQACGSLHCRISGPSYVGIGLVAALGALGLFSLDRSWLFAAFAAVAVLSYGIEAAVERSGEGSAA